MINRFTIIVYIFLVSGMILSCGKFNEDQGVPAFLHIDKIKLNAGVGQGTDSAYIADAWVYIDNVFHGAFELPATIPLLKTGMTSLTIRPGVIVNGISATRSIYPFYASIPLNVNLVADSTINYSFITTYTTNSKFPWNSVGQEDFEQGGISLDTLPGSNATIVKSKADVYEGDYSGHVLLDADHQNFMAASSDFAIPDNKSGLVLEMNIKNPDNLVIVGIYFNLPGGTVAREEYLYVNPTDDWKKLYVNFTQLMVTYSTAATFKIFFISDLPSGQTDANIYFDNIKLVHFNE